MGSGSLVVSGVGGSGPQVAARIGRGQQRSVDFSSNSSPMPAVGRPFRRLGAFRFYRANAVLDSFIAIFIYLLTLLKIRVYCFIVVVPMMYGLASGRALGVRRGAARGNRRILGGLIRW